MPHYSDYSIYSGCLKEVVKRIIQHKNGELFSVQENSRKLIAGARSADGAVIYGLHDRVGVDQVQVPAVADHH